MDPLHNVYAVAVDPPILSSQRSSVAVQSSLSIPKKPKRKQVKNACIHCQKACKKCDDGRACKRCLRLGLEASCIDSPRKPRRKGIRRGPYKPRQKVPRALAREVVGHPLDYQPLPEGVNETNRTTLDSQPFFFTPSFLSEELYDQQTTTVNLSSVASPTAYTGSPSGRIAPPIATESSPSLLLLSHIPPTAASFSIYW
ncbi:hypothetical protein BX666DRAFT_2029050 [Dichotomocladium elegans]|nr:hypothetical protein BX666DRAFT_2029050 [Dichotomocladium elegans]